MLFGVFSCVHVLHSPSIGQFWMQSLQSLRGHATGHRVFVMIKAKISPTSCRLSLGFDRSFGLEQLEQTEEG